MSSGGAERHAAGHRHPGGLRMAGLRRAMGRRSELRGPDCARHPKGGGRQGARAPSPRPGDTQPQDGPRTPGTIRRRRPQHSPRGPFRTRSQGVLRVGRTADTGPRISPWSSAAGSDSSTRPSAGSKPSPRSRSRRRMDTGHRRQPPNPRGHPRLSAFPGCPLTWVQGSDGSTGFSAGSTSHREVPAFQLGFPPGSTPTYTGSFTWPI